jgi:hypothetical protein
VVVLVNLVAGFYFAFKLFPAGSNHEVSANIPKAFDVIAGAPVDIEFKRGAPLQYNGNVVPSHSTSAAAPVLKNFIDADDEFETGAPLHYRGQ